MPGVYANGLAIGFNQHELVIDYLVDVAGPGMPPTVELLQRVRIPIAMSRDLLSNVSTAMDNYESKFGPIHRPGE